MDPKEVCCIVNSPENFAGHCSDEDLSNNASNTVIAAVATYWHSATWDLRDFS